MYFRKSLGAGSALCTIFAASTALADLTPAQVWDGWQSYLEGYGYKVAAKKSGGGDSLTLDGVTINADLPEDEGQITMTYGTLTLVDQGDGTVAVQVPDSVPFSLMVNAEGEEVLIKGTAHYTGMSMIASGDPANVTYSYSADAVSARVDEVTVDGEGPDGPFEVLATLAKISGESSISFGDLINVAQVFSSESLTINASGEDDSGSSLTALIEVAGLGFDFTGAAPKVSDPNDTVGMFAGGLAAKGTITQDGTTITAQGADSGTPFNVELSAGAGTLNMDANAEFISYAGAVSDLSAAMAGGDIPLPVSFQMGEYSYSFLMPMMASETDQDFGFSLTLADVTISDMLWSIFDPTQILPRDPATIRAKISGTGKLFVDLMSPEFEEMNEMPGEVTTLKIDDIEVSAAGAKATGTGAFTFDNTDLETFDGIPRPIGTVEFNILGVNGLIDKLVQMGIVPEEEANMARMMMPIVTIAGPGEDELISVIEFTEEGQLLANGQRLQ